MSNYIKYEDYKKIQDLKAQGFNKNQTYIKTKIRKPTIMKYWNVTEDEYFNMSHDEASDLLQYSEFLTEIVRLTPIIKDSVLLCRLRERFQGTEIKQATFYRFIKSLRSRIGLERKTVRSFTLVEHKNPGEEMQVDMGEKVLIDMYGNSIKVYFVAFILSYSRMRFCYFSNLPVTTQILIKAHEFAFKYFGGATKILMYDQSKIMIYNETAGNIIFVKEFEEYVKHAGFAVYLCKKYDPCTKGKVENTVRVIKMNFLEGRQYCGISSLNSASLKWLDEFCNATINRHTLKTPQEMFEVERKHLLQTKAYINPTGKISSVTEGGTVMYKNNLYTYHEDYITKMIKFVFKKMQVN